MYFFFSVLSYSSNNPDTDGDHVFPESDDDVNGTFITIPAQITIPKAFLAEQMGPNRMLNSWPRYKLKIAL